MDRFSPKLVTVFGGSGFVGKHLAQAAASQNAAETVA